MGKPEKHGKIGVYVRKREDGLISVSVHLVEWKPKHLTSLPQNAQLQARLAARISLAVYEIFGASSE